MMLHIVFIQNQNFSKGKILQFDPFKRGCSEAPLDKAYLLLCQAFFNSKLNNNNNNNNKSCWYCGCGYGCVSYSLERDEVDDIRVTTSLDKERTYEPTVNSQCGKETILPYNTEIDEITEYCDE